MRILICLFWRIYEKSLWMSGKFRGLLQRIRVAHLRFQGVQFGKNLRLGTHVTFSLGQKAKLVVGDNVIIGDYVWITVGDNAELRIGDNTYIFHHCAISSSTQSAIGEYCSLAPYVTIIDSNHRYRDATLPIRFQGGDYEPIHISDEVWIGTGAVILRGVRLGRHCVIGANAVVTTDVPAFAVATGVPARVTERFQDE